MRARGRGRDFPMPNGAPPYSTIKNARWRRRGRAGMLWLTNAETDQENIMPNTATPAIRGPGRACRPGLL